MDLRARGWTAWVTTAWLLTSAVPARAEVPDPDAHAPAAVVGLDAEGSPPEAARLTQALRGAFARRGLSGGKEAHLSELRLVLGCRTDEPACLAGGGDVLQARRLIYGTLDPAPHGGWALELSVLEVESAEVTAQERFTLDAGALGSERIEQTAADVVAQLLPEVAEPTEAEVSGVIPPPPPPPDGDGGDDEVEAREGSKGGKLRFGYQRPTPRWKWVGFGVSTGLLVISAGTAIGTGVWITASDDASFGFRRQLLDAAESSLREPDPFNRVDPQMSGDLCGYNRTDDDGMPLLHGVRHEGVGRVCTNGEDARRRLLTHSIVAIVSGVSTVVFTALLLVHREPAGKVARTWRRRGLQLDLGPTPGVDGQAQGAMVGLRGRL